MVTLLLATFSLTTVGCAGTTFWKKGDDNAKTTEEVLFDNQRSDQEKMSEFAASAGRKDPKEKKNVSKGETFLLSDKAKEIYAHTER